ncbi:MAG: dTDP-4-dehydrorhamnose 3,5-epimerase [Pseudomonadales bacterium]|nr:dTDP-4-dehydrorhamnose 3,5-epimerase [Pseudomonadales bacterium]MDP6473018.1 dTDP-4-dehydrorhamnose 3,5-epimerase [Pseudomonadales bacterium]MDP6826225.1 dTDP-4-dehydrorhamnose 3,5-epimerase [Pseudomonadales bacterium]
MNVHPTKFEGAYLIEPEPMVDERGFFARVWCEREMEAFGVSAHTAQASVSFNRRRGTLRGMHYQLAPHEEDKLVRCTNGAIYDVIVDLRPQSPTYLGWESFELSAENRHTLFVPRGLAHGFQTLADDTEVFYQISKYYVPQAGAGLRYDDPAIGIRWPEPVRLISEKDARFPYLSSDEAQAHEAKTSSKGLN